MKGSLLVVLLAVLVCACHTTPPNLIGISFSEVTVVGPESSVAYDYIHHYLINQGARLGVAGAPSLMVQTRVEYSRDAVAIVSLYGETSTGVSVTGTRSYYSIGGGLQAMMSGSAEELVHQLGRKIRRTRVAGM